LECTFQRWTLSTGSASTTFTDGAVDAASANSSRRLQPKIRRSWRRCGSPIRVRFGKWWWAGRKGTWEGWAGGREEKGCIVSRVFLYTVFLLYTSTSSKLRSSITGQPNVSFTSSVLFGNNFRMFVLIRVLCVILIPCRS